MAYKELKIEAQSVCLAITDWTTVQMNLTDHAGKYLRRIIVHNRTTLVEDRSSVGHILIARKAQGVPTIFDTLVDNNLFGYWEGLTWEGSIYIDDAMYVQLRYVARAVNDVISMEAVISETPGANYAMPKPRNRIIQKTAVTATGGGGAITVNYTCPVGRRWKVFDASAYHDDTSQTVTIAIVSGTTLMHLLVNKDGLTSGAYAQFSVGQVATGTVYVPAQNITKPSYVAERNILRFAMANSASSKNFTQNYTMIEEPDSQIPIPT
jgi:hypothetical protein